MMLFVTPFKKWRYRNRRNSQATADIDVESIIASQWSSNGGTARRQLTQMWRASQHCSGAVTGGTTRRQLTQMWRASQHRSGAVTGGTARRQLTQMWRASQHRSGAVTGGTARRQLTQMWRASQWSSNRRNYQATVDVNVESIVVEQ